jgi:hypothetical protein
MRCASAHVGDDNLLAPVLRDTGRPLGWPSPNTCGAQHWKPHVLDDDRQITRSEQLIEVPTDFEAVGERADKSVTQCL